MIDSTEHAETVSRSVIGVVSFGSICMYSL